jgi:RNA polymerase sigma-70 factor (ECF subfamily)
MISDEALMLDFQRGSREAFEELFARYRHSLCGFFRRRLGIAERADDLTQETFLAVIRGTSRYEPRALVRTYLYAIALKLLAAERRRQSKDAGADKGADAATQPAASEAADAALWVRQALERLDPAEREILMLREFEQLSYQEIAELLRLPVNTVRSRLFRSRMALKGHLEPAGKEASNA